MTTAMAHQFDDAEQQQQAATLGMWLFLASEVLFFGGMLAGYAVYRAAYPRAFALGSGRLDVWLGTLNTAVLLTSSLTVALAVAALQSDRRSAAAGLLIGTVVLGMVFLGVKGVEYAHKFDERLVPGRSFHFVVEDGNPGGTHHRAQVATSAQDSWDFRESLESELQLLAGRIELFFSFYFALTGVHALHMLIGVAVFTVLAWQVIRGKYSRSYFTPVELAGLYWHFVDIIWVFLFPLLYLIDLNS